MRVALAFDKFKGTFSAQEVCELIAEGIHDRNPKIEIIQRPMADGGEGSAHLLSAALGLETMRLEVHDLLGKKAEANIYWQNTRRLAVIESAEILGVNRCLISEENLLKANTIGLGQLLRRTFDLRPQEIWICLGGTLTADLGWGIASVFGLNAYDKTGQQLSPCIFNMDKIEKIDFTNQPDFIKKCKISILCDVNAPVTSQTGISLTSFLKQKGSSEENIPFVLNKLELFWNKLKAALPSVPSLNDNYMGTGGGLCLGLSAVFSHLKIELGSKKIAKAIALKASFSGCEIVVCGEGCLDALSLQGKTITAVSELALKEHCKLVGIFGKIVGDERELKNKLGLSQVFKIINDNQVYSQQDLVKFSRTKFYQIGLEIADMIKK